MTPWGLFVAAWIKFQVRCGIVLGEEAAREFHARRGRGE